MKLLKRTVIAILAILLALAIAVFCVWGNEIATLMSMTQVRERNDEHLDGSVCNLTDRTALWVSNENYDDPTTVFQLSFE